MEPRSAEASNTERSNLREREEWGATLEILGDEAVMAAIRRSKAAWAAGRWEEFIDLDEQASYSP